MLTTWVNSWFYHPGVNTTPPVNRRYCFAAAVDLMGSYIYGNDDRKVKRTLHDLFTYLFLGWNPITKWPNESDYQKPEKELLDITQVQEAIKKLMDFERPTTCSSLYPLLTYLTTACKKYNADSEEFYIGERITMIMTSLWLLKKETLCPIHDLGLIRGLLDLYYRSDAIAVEDESVEYARTAHQLRYYSWFNTQVERLIRMRVSTEELVSDLAYIGWYVALIRANRMLKASTCLSNDYRKPLEARLDGEVKIMMATLDSAALKCSEDQVRDGSSLRSSARLLKLLKFVKPKVKYGHAT